MLCLRSLGFPSHDHLVRTLDFEWRNVMLGFNLFQTTLGRRNLSLQFFGFFRLDALLAKLCRVAFNVTLECTRFPVKRSNRVNQALPDRLFQVKLSNLL